MSSPWVEGEGLMEEKIEKGWGSPSRALLARQFWPLSFTRIDPATTALPLVVLCGPIRG